MSANEYCDHKDHNFVYVEETKPKNLERYSLHVIYRHSSGFFCVFHVNTTLAHILLVREDLCPEVTAHWPCYLHATIGGHESACEASFLFACKCPWIVGTIFFPGGYIQR